MTTDYLNIEKLHEIIDKSFYSLVNILKEKKLKQWLYKWLY